MATTTAFQLTRVRGVPIRIHVTFLLILPFLAWSFGRSFVDAARLAGVPAGRISGPPWLWGLGIALALFGSVLVHELAHTLYALRQGGKVRAITLLMFGGVSELEAAPRREAAMALAGPVTSLVLGAAFVGCSRLAAPAIWPSTSFALFYLGQLNLVLGVFNLLPAFPMDGGRVLRGALARRIGALRATRIAARVGRAFALLFAMIGFLEMNVMLLLVSFVVYAGAEAELADTVVRASLGDLRVRDLMSPLDAGVDARASLADVASRMIAERRTGYPVTEGARVTGFVSIDAVKRIAPDARGRTRAGDVAVPVRVLDVDRRIADVLQLLRERAPEAAVVEADRLVGTLSERDVSRGLELRELELQAPGRAADAQQPMARS